MPVISSRTLEIDYSDEGHGPPVILIHSSVSGNRQWRSLTDSLTDRYRVLAPNLYGYGGTTPWPDVAPQSLFAQADGGLFGRGLGDSLVQLPGATHCTNVTDCAILPAPHTDFIYAVIVDELGLFGGAAVVLIYALISERGFKTAVLAEDGFSKLLATGLTTILALQAFVIIGGVTRVIPLTGVTLPFISYGGSSMLALSIGMGLLLAFTRRNPYLTRSPYAVKWSGESLTT